jgi:hypothetical protein
VKIKTRYAGIAIITVLVFSAFISTFQGSYAISQESQSSTQKENGDYSAQVSSEKVGVEEHKITAAELGKLKSQVGFYEEGQNYNQIVNGHGTGLSPPTQEEWVDIAQTAYFVDDVTYGSSPASVDLSATPWFPPIGNQANQGSCVAWSVGYYVKTFQEAKEHSWNLSGATWEGGYSGYPTLGYQNRIISPAFVYNLINNGLDGGSSFYNAIQLTCFIGASSWEKMPYNRLDYTSWPSEAAWTEAPYYRGNSSGYQYMNINTDADLEKLKNWLASENLATIAVDGNKFSNLTNSDLWTLDNYNNPVTNHAATIVGYDDNFNYTETGTIRYGAFKIANSWGKGFTGEKVADGFYWISYEAMKQRVSLGGPCMFYFDSINYQPSLMAKFRIDHSKRSECTVTVGLGTPSAQIQTKRFSDYVLGGSVPFCSNNIVLDVTEFKKYMATSYNQPFFLKVYDGGTNTTGTITYFAIENSVASGTPLQTNQSNNVYLTVYYSTAPPTLTVSPTSGPPSGNIILNCAGFTAGSSVNISYLNPVTSMWIPIINNLATSFQNFTYTMNAPDLLQNNLAGDHQPLFDNLVFRAQDNSNIQSFNSTTPYTQWRRGLAQVGNLTAQGLYGNNTNLATSVFVQNDDSVPVYGAWFSPGSVSLLWDGITNLGTILTNSTGFFNATVLVPTTTAGQHTLVIRDNRSDFCFNLTRLPTVSNDYVDFWHTTNFPINLLPDYTVSETFYRINNGPVCSFSADGQPVITAEGSSNMLEYWCTWNVYGTSTMELAHVTLTGIKLDKTAPTGSITINSNYVNTTTVTLALSAADSTSGIAQMRFSNDNATWSSWEQNATSKTWNLQNGDGTKTITVQYRDNAGLSSSFNCTIILDTTKPVANAGQNKNVNSGATVTFDAGISSDEVGIVSYLWDFGDGSTGTGKTATHTYSSAGTYAAKLTVQDAAGNTETSNVSVTVQENVIPEYSTFTVLFFMITMLTITLLIKKRNLTLK